MASRGWRVADIPAHTPEGLRKAPGFIADEIAPGLAVVPVAAYAGAVDRIDRGQVRWRLFASTLGRPMGQERHLTYAPDGIADVAERLAAEHDWANLVSIDDIDDVSMQRIARTFDEAFRDVSASDAEAWRERNIADYDPARLKDVGFDTGQVCLLYTSPSPRDQRGSRMPSSA